MVDALKVKSDGSFALKGTGSFSVKGGGAPAYVIEGLTQSHWLASNAVLSGNNITSVTDSSGTENLIETSFGYTATYDETGWVSGGKTLPTMNLTGPRLKADGWGGRVSNGSAFTVALLMQKSDVESNFARNRAGIPCGWMNDGFTSHQMKGPKTLTSMNGTQLVTKSQSYYTLQRINGSSYNYTSADMVAALDLPQVDKQLMIFEFGGTGQNWRLWLNGSAITLGNQLTQASQSNMTFNKFTICGYPSDQMVLDAKIAEFHIWNNTLTDSQRAAVTTDLMTRGGL